MIASAPIAGTLRTIPDAASAPPQDSGVPTHANFRSVLEQYHVSRDSDSNTDDPKSAREQKQKDSDPAALAVPQPVTPPVEAPRLILPFTTSITLRQDVTASPDAAAPQEATALSDDAAATQNHTTTAADPNAVPAAIATTPRIPATLRSTLDLPAFHLESDTKPNSVPSGKPPKTQIQTHAKLRAELQAESKDSVPSQTVAAPLASTAPADPSTQALPVTSSTTLDQTGTAVQISSTVSEAPETASTSISTLDRGVSILTTTRNAAYQYHSSHQADSATIGTSRTVEQQPKISDPTAAIAAPIPVAPSVDSQPLLHPPAASNTPRQDAPALQSSPAAPQDSSAASATDSKTVMPPVAGTDDPAAAPPQGSLAFAARLTPTEETPAPAATPAPDASRTADSPSRAQTALPSAAPAAPRQIASQADLPADAHGGESGSQSDKEKTGDRFAKPEVALPQTHATFQDQTAAPAASHLSTSPLSPATRLDQVQDPPATAPSGNHDITIRIPDANTDQGTAVRFVERAGEVHVSVRTGDADMAQTLRGGLNDLVNRLEDGGIRTQVWQPGADASTSHNDSHQPFADPDGSNGRQHSSGSKSEQESQQHNKPRWVEELEGSIGNPNLKETTQLPWQA